METDPNHREKAYSSLVWGVVHLESKVGYIAEQTDERENEVPEQGGLNPTDNSEENATDLMLYHIDEGIDIDLIFCELKSIENSRGVGDVGVNAQTNDCSEEVQGME